MNELDIERLKADGEMPALPETHYNACGDGSEPLYTPDMVHLYAIQYAERQSKRAVLGSAEPVKRLSDVQIDTIRNEVMQRLSAENAGVLGGPDVEHMQFPKRFADAIMTAIGSTVPCCAVCGDAGKWLAGYTGIFGGTVPVYEPCNCASAPPSTDAKDSERLDFLEGLRVASAAKGFKWDSFIFDAGKPIRAAIDAAIAAKEAGK